MEEVVQQHRNHNKRRFNFRASLCIPYALFMALFVVIPLFIVFYYAFTNGEGKFVLSNWSEIFSNSNNWKIIGLTFVVSAVTTLICILIGYPVAYLLANSKYNKNRILVYIFILPMWINFVIRTIALKDLVNQATSALFGFDITAAHPYVAIVIGMVYDYLPFAILPLYNQMLKLDKNQIEAAADLGANPAQVFIKSIVPQTVPGIISACLMTFMPTMSSYVIANKMSENNKMIIGNIIQDYFIKRNTPISNHVGSVMSLVMLLIVGVTILVQKLLDKSDDSKKGDLW